LWNNGFNGSVPSAIGNLTMLIALYLDGNNFEGMLGPVLIDWLYGWHHLLRICSFLLPWIEYFSIENTNNYAQHLRRQKDVRRLLKFLFSLIKTKILINT